MITVAEQSVAMYRAVLLPRLITKRQVWDAAGIVRRCTAVEVPRVCNVRCGRTPITDHPPVVIQKGSGLHVDILSHSDEPLRVCASHVGLRESSVDGTQEATGGMTEPSELMQDEVSEAISGAATTQTLELDRLIPQSQSRM